MSCEIARDGDLGETLIEVAADQKGNQIVSNFVIYNGYMRGILLGQGLSLQKRLQNELVHQGNVRHLDGISEDILE